MILVELFSTFELSRNVWFWVICVGCNRNLEEPNKLWRISYLKRISQNLSLSLCFLAKMKCMKKLCKAWQNKSAYIKPSPKSVFSSHDNILISRKIKKIMVFKILNFWIKIISYQHTKYLIYKNEYPFPNLSPS
jgi:hypothetical protein